MGNHTSLARGVGEQTGKPVVCQKIPPKGLCSAGQFAVCLMSVFVGYGVAKKRARSRSTPPRCACKHATQPILLPRQAAERIPTGMLLYCCTHRITLRRRVLGLLEIGPLGCCCCCTSSLFVPLSSSPSRSSSSDREAHPPALCFLLHHLAISGKVPLEIIRAFRSTLYVHAYRPAVSPCFFSKYDHVHPDIFDGLCPCADPPIFQ